MFGSRVVAIWLGVASTEGWPPADCTGDGDSYGDDWGSEASPWQPGPWSAAAESPGEEDQEERERDEEEVEGGQEDLRHDVRPPGPVFLDADNRVGTHHQEEDEEGRGERQRVAAGPADAPGGAHAVETPTGEDLR